ncbi:GAMM1 protein/Ni-binding urease accessory protein (UreG), related protein [Rhizoctonia solani 123E]|uniref:GAMM1 protein/Ni-binding urease accessory protein (UreG), related protein n=1 Tax=Rhizoctonia solani 123E TaxID=1423351 RepID=A0A074SLT9_9AGAM|nr:GAMM1 protein/Ni-binding urease accessory protein (UreG), related protein [Rhizoctonia solani 123E]
MSEESASKKLRTTGPTRIIGTHNGTFHCDEALAVFLLRQTKEYADASVTRTRDPKILETCDIVVDVGAVYDPERLLFDHHQRGFTEVFGNGFKTKLSSAGLIYKHFGLEIITNQLQLGPTEAKVQELWLKLYGDFIEAIDGIDNGVLQYPSEIPPAYRNRTNLSSRVGHLNPRWNESVDSDGVDARFQKASELTGTEFLGRLDYLANAWWPARDLVSNAIEARIQFEPTGRIILFEQFAPWKEHLFELESSLNIPEEKKPIYVLYPDETGGNWRIQAVPVSPDSFESRKALPEAWRGVRDAQLDEITGVPGGIFVHASGFIGGNKTKGGVLAMAQKALAL